MVPNMHQMWRAYGGVFTCRLPAVYCVMCVIGWTFAFRDYYALNFTAEIDLPEMQKVRLILIWLLHGSHDDPTQMADIIDPYSYLSRYTMPTMVIDSTGDEFFQLDDNWLWWDKVRLFLNSCSPFASLLTQPRSSPASPTHTSS